MAFGKVYNGEGKGFIEKQFDSGSPIYCEACEEFWVDDSYNFVDCNQGAKSTLVVIPKLIEFRIVTYDVLG